MIQTGSRCLFSINISKMLQCSYLSRNVDDVVTLLRNTIQDGNSKDPYESVSWAKVASSKHKSKKKIIKKVEYFAPSSSTAFSHFSLINKALVAKLNDIYCTVLPIQDKVLPKILKNR